MIMVSFTIAGFTSIINQLLPEPHAGLLAGLLFGTKASIPRDFYNALVASGTLHIIALSGQNISIMESLIGMILLPLVGKRLASAFTIGVIVWFVWFVGPSPSVIRAAIMGSLSLIAILFGRQYWAILSWIITVGIMLIIHIGWLFDISFQLSAMATLGIILFGGKESSVSNNQRVTTARVPTDTRSDANLSQKSIWSLIYSHLTEDSYKEKTSAARGLIGGIRGWQDPLYSLGKMVWKFAGDSLHLTLAAQVFTIPLILFSFHRFSLIAPLANLAIGWVIAPVTLLGWVTVLAGFWVLWIGQVVAWIDWIFLEYLIRTVYFMSRLPMSSFGW